MKIRQFYSHMQAAQDVESRQGDEHVTAGLHRLRSVEVGRLLERRRYSDTWNRWNMDHSPADADSASSPLGRSGLTVPTLA